MFSYPLLVIRYWFRPASTSSENQHIGYRHINTSFLVIRCWLSGLGSWFFHLGSGSASAPFDRLRASAPLDRLRASAPLDKLGKPAHRFWLSVIRSWLLVLSSWFRPRIGTSSENRYTGYRHILRPSIPPPAKLSIFVRFNNSGTVDAYTIRKTYFVGH